MNLEIAPPDRIAPLAEKVRDELAKAERPLTAKDLVDRIEPKMSEALVRDGLERLLFRQELDVSVRREPGKRGAAPLAYALKKPVAS